MTSLFSTQSCGAPRGPLRPHFLRAARAAASAGCCALLATPALARPAASPEPTAEARPEVIEELVVRAHPLSGEGLAQPTESLSGERLSRSLAASVGETVGRLPGVHNASFGQASGRPVIHGLGGPRVRVMEDRIDSLDASVTSADHAVAVESFIAEEIEILKGPSTLLYGTGAVGGVVDVHTARIPHSGGDGSLSGRAEVRGADNADLRQGAFRLDGGGSRFAMHVDGFYREADAFEIDGFVESEALRAEEAAEAAAAGDSDDEPEARGRVPGSQLEQRGGAIGASYIGERGFVGASISVLEADYGLPGGHEHEHEAGDGDGEEEEEGNPTLELEQVRLDVEAGLDSPLPGFASANLRFALNDYEHTEFEPNGEAGTRFGNEAWELRLELVHLPVLGFDGAVGLQLQSRDFEAIGDEAFVPPVETRRSGVFWVGETDLAGGELELGLRLEDVEHDPSNQAGSDFFVWAGSAGLNFDYENDWFLGLVADVAERAPVAEELYSNGPHLATQSFEVGDPNLDEEGVFGLSFTVGRRAEAAGVTLTLYANEFTDFIYETPTGAEADGLPVFAFRQSDASFAGVDLSAYWRPVAWDLGSLTLKTQFDTVRASIDAPRGGDSDVPRLPAQRYGFGAALAHGGFVAELEYLRVSAQRDVTDFELPTSGFDDVRLTLNYQLALGAQATPLTLFLQGRNLTDSEQRLHTSFIKDFTPQPGRTIEAGLRFAF